MNKSQTPNRFLKCVWALLLLTTVSLTGCSNLGLRSPRLTFDEKPLEVPRKIIPVWTDTVLHTAGEKPTRGFGGRVMFYGENENQPIEVDGSLIVYAWNDTELEKSSRSPDRKYVFAAEKLSKHFSESKVGSSYSFWLPWDTVGGQMQNVTLITRFVSKQGGEVTSTAARMVLPGKVDSPEPTGIASRTGRQKPRASAIQLAGHESVDLDREELFVNEDEQGRPPQRTTMESTTIDLPPSFLKRQSIASAYQPAVEQNSATNSNATAPATPSPFSTSGSVWEQLEIEPGTSPEAGSRLTPHRAQKKPVAQRLADRARMRRPRSAWPSSYGQTPARQVGGHSTEPTGSTAE